MAGVRRDVVGADGFSAEAARAALVAACRRVGLVPAGAELLRLGEHAVFRLAGEPVIARVARTEAYRPEIDREARVARWLAEESFPANRLVPSVPQPLSVDGRVVTFWESVQEREEYATLGELAELLRRLHWLEEPEALGLEHLDPFGKTWQRFDGLAAVPAEDREWLRRRADELAKLYDRLDFVLPPGVVHGDANIGNVLRHRDGHAVLIDLDTFALGPREWDLVLTALYYERFGWHTREEYEGFVYRYGFDIMNWPGYPVLADIRELVMTVWLGQNVGHDDQVAAEFAHRMDALRSGGSRRDWKPF